MLDSVPLGVRAVLLLGIIGVLAWWDVRRCIRNAASDVQHRQLAYRVIFLCGLAGGMFGLLMDQVTCTISPDYFRVFKEVPGQTDTELRLGAANLGFAAGMIPGLICGICFAAAVTLNAGHLFSTAKVLWLLAVPLTCFVCLAPILGWYQAQLDPTGLRDTLRLGSDSRVSRLLFVWGTHQAAYVAGILGTVLATVLLSCRVRRAK